MLKKTVTALSVAALAGVGAMNVMPEAVAKSVSNQEPIELAMKHGCNPCNPCGAKKHGCNPCNPCAAKKGGCNPCAAKKHGCNPCNPCAAKK